jgi:hypothetical protein
VSVLSGKRAAKAGATRSLKPQPARAMGVARAAARSAAAWSAPRVNGARAWTAPRIEQSGLAIRDSVAPKICEMLTATARRVDVTAPRVDVTAPWRRRSKVVAGTALTTAAGAAAAVALRRRKDDGTSGSEPG